MRLSELQSKQIITLDGRLVGNIVDIVAGTFFLCSAPSDSENFEGLSDEQIETYKKRFDALEFYINY